MVWKLKQNQWHGFYGISTGFRNIYVSCGMFFEWKAIILLFGQDFHGTFFIRKDRIRNCFPFVFLRVSMGMAEIVSAECQSKSYALRLDSRPNVYAWNIWFNLISSYFLLFYRIFLSLFYVCAPKRKTSKRKSESHARWYDKDLSLQKSFYKPHFILFIFLRLHQKRNFQRKKVPLRCRFL